MGDIVIDVLKEELQNAKERLCLYPKGKGRFAHAHLRAKKQGPSIYYYLQWKEKGKQKSEYLGKLSHDEVEKYRAIIAQAKSELNKSKELMKRIKFIERSLKYESIVE